MKGAAAFTSLMAPRIERYLTLKRALGREYDGVRRVLAHVDHFVTTQDGDLTWAGQIHRAANLELASPSPSRRIVRVQFIDSRTGCAARMNHDSVTEPQFLPRLQSQTSVCILVVA